MKRKIFSILFTLVLVVSFSLVAAVPVGANTDRLVPSAYNTIQLAIDAADSGDTIIVDATYTGAGETFPITVGVANLTIQAAGSAAISGTAGTVVAITANSVTVSGFTIIGTAAAPNVFTDCGVTLTNVSDCTIEDNIVSYDGGIGIKLHEADGNIIWGNSIVGSSIAGIALFGSSSNTVDSNVSNDTILTDIDGNATGYGIWLDYSPPEGNAPPYPGPGYSTLNTINNNTFSGNEEDGVYFGQDGNVNTLTNNIITNNGKVGADDGHGVSFWQSGSNTVTGNTITGNYASGMEIYASPDNVITHNTITGNNVSLHDKRGGFRIRDGYPHSTGNLINNNNISGNQVWGIFSKTASAVDATNNWWGATDGPSLSPGSGDRVSDNVDFDPWLESPFQESAGAVGMTAASEEAFIGISVSPSSINFGPITSGAVVSGDALTVKSTGNVRIMVDAEITADTVFGVKDGKDLYFYTAALRLNGGPSDRMRLDPPDPSVLGKWAHSDFFGPDPFWVNESRSVTTGLECPSPIYAATTYDGTVVFWAEPLP